MNVPCLIYVPSRLLISNHPQYFSERLASSRHSTIGFEPFVSTPREATKHETPTCYRCAKGCHLSEDCRFKCAVCNFCKRKGHLQSVCRKKKQHESEVKSVAVKSISDEATAAVPKLEIPVKINDQTCSLELDTAAGRSFPVGFYMEAVGQA